MPTRSYYFPPDFAHLEAMLNAEPEDFTSEEALRFREKGLPPIPRIGTLPIFLGVSPKIIFSIRRSTRKHYRSFQLAKKDGTKRNIDTPRTYLKVIQWWILDNILNKISVNEHVFGFVAGRSAIDNAKYHLGANHLLNIDIKQFFPSITEVQVRDIFCSLGYSLPVSELLSDLCCLDGHVPQGAPTSPAIANLVLRNLDDALIELSIKAGYRYSRYADDLTFSSKSRIESEFLKEVEYLIRRSGFELKPEKTRFSGAGRRMEVTGVVINEKLQPTRSWRKYTRAKLHRLSLAQRLIRRDVSYLHGVLGIAKQFPASSQMQIILSQAIAVLEKRSTTIGLGGAPMLPSRLTVKQAEALAALRPGITNADIATKLKTTEASIKKRLQESFRKIGVTDRSAAYYWAKDNI